ncbi:MAG: M48 family metallopeptidase [Flavobacteriaceae bacterium]|nr:M48 family metallopeptidase [Flavobacteriaceae bacterium]
MTPKAIFIVFIVILLFDFSLDKFLDYLNAKRFNHPIPDPLKDVYNEDEYLKSQEYKTERFQFGNLTATFSLVLTLSFLFIDGFKLVDDLARSITDNSILIGLLFFGIIMVGSTLFTLPFSYYSTFIIEDKYGFNKTTKKTFFLDKIKSGIMGAIIGGGLLAFIIFIYEKTQENFWIYAWGVITIFSLFMNMFYSKLIVPLFNKQTPLEKGSLRDKISTYASQVGFKLDNIFVIDGSKRSTKANAYFSGFGGQKRITLYDTLIHDLEEDEIVSVLAHEVGHYKKKHIIFNLTLSIITTGLTLWILSIFIDSSILAKALAVDIPSFHIGLIAFGLLYSPISHITGLLMNIVSRKFEYQADNYAKNTHNASDLISSLKKLSKNNLSNLTPHPWYVWFHYSHPSLLQRIQNLQNN